MSDSFEHGNKVRRQILGDRFVDKTEAAMTPLDAKYRKLTSEGLWGTVWASDGISLREKSMVTVAILASGGLTEELGLHLHVAAKNGASREDIMEVFLHVATYAGIPRSNQAIKTAKAIWAQMDEAAAAAKG